MPPSSMSASDAGADSGSGGGSSGPLSNVKRFLQRQRQSQTLPGIVTTTEDLGGRSGSAQDAARAESGSGRGRGREGPADSGDTAAAHGRDGRVDVVAEDDDADRVEVLADGVASMKIIADDDHAPSEEEEPAGMDAPQGPMLASRVRRVRELVFTSAQADLDELRNVAWSGLSPELRPHCWRLLLGYVVECEGSAWHRLVACRLARSSTRGHVRGPSWQRMQLDDAGTDDAASMFPFIHASAFAFFPCVCPSSMPE